ncbi:cyclic GMP-AMP synthase-like receptor isoform X1 [Maniola hyperantus]|uniref:cyclic GMP-AMP synthase-like receptor isoform X1 n=1 Tax=Aphantopus hyperantus TaxID=2795564 RepID=UPI002127FDA5
MESSNLNSLLADIHNRYIKLKEKDFQLHYRVFGEVFRSLQQNMKAVDKYYERYVSNIQFAGSHYDNLRINKPDEFDMDIVIDVPVSMHEDPLYPANSDILIEKYRPEYLWLRAGAQFRNIPYRDGQDSSINRTAYEWLDKKNFILGSKFSDWFKSVGNRGLNEFQKLNGRPVCFVDGVAYTIRSSSSGPAWTIHIESDGFKMDVDLVPALKFPESRWLGKKYRKIPERCRREYWLAVPKPNPDGPSTPHEEQRSWRLALQDQEKQLLYNTYHLRQIIRLIKKFRDAQGMDKLASYYIKTIFFWEIADFQDGIKSKKLNKKEAFWQQNDIATLFKHMLQKLYDALAKKNIPYFWNRGKNYIQRWDIARLNEYKGKINDLLNVLKNPYDYKSVAKYLLTDKEYQEYRKFL